MSVSLCSFGKDHVGFLGFHPVREYIMATEMERIFLEMELIDIEQQYA